MADFPYISCIYRLYSSSLTSIAMTCCRYEKHLYLEDLTIINKQQWSRRCSFVCKSFYSTDFTGPQMPTIYKCHMVEFSTHNHVVHGECSWWQVSCFGCSTHCLRQEYYVGFHWYFGYLWQYYINCVQAVTS